MCIYISKICEICGKNFFMSAGQVSAIRAAIHFEKSKKIKNFSSSLTLYLIRSYLL